MQIKTTPSACRAVSPSPPPPFQGVSSSACRVCASVFRQAGGFGPAACGQLAALLSLPVFVGSTAPVVPTGQALPFQCIFVVSATAAAGLSATLCARNQE